IQRVDFRKESINIVESQAIEETNYVKENLKNDYKVDKTIGK
ncbi:6602_t:CDS:1, partial [Funneliformis mosseae]